MKTLHVMVADKLERDPSLLRIPLENIDRWLANGHTAPHRLEQWRQIILRAQESEAGFQALLDVLRDPSKRAVRQRDFASFAGVLTTLERRAYILQHPYSHDVVLPVSNRSTEHFSRTNNPPPLPPSAFPNSPHVKSPRRRVGA